MPKLNKFLSLILSFCLILEQKVFAQTIDLSHYFAHGSNQTISRSDKFRPLHLRYISYDSQANDFKILLDKGDYAKGLSPAGTVSDSRLEQETQELMKYFFIGLSLPNEKFWVNLRPDSPDNILDPELEKTDIGRIFLEADLQLKKDTSGMTSPQTKEGREYWDKLYKKAGELFGSENITIPTLTRPWIVPDEIIIREAPDNAYIYKATLKVMLEEDYLTSRGGSRTAPTYQQSAFPDPRLKELNEYSTQLIKETIIPKLTYAVNTSKRYAPLRQVYYSLILAQWFKRKYGSSGNIRVPGSSVPVNSYIDLIDSGNLTNLTSIQPYDKQSYFQKYQKSFKDGEYNLQEPVYTPMGQSIRRYTSGGAFFGEIEKVSSSVKAGEKNNFAENREYLYSIASYNSVLGGVVSSPMSFIPELAQRIENIFLSIKEQGLVANGKEDSVGSMSLGIDRNIHDHVHGILIKQGELLSWQNFFADYTAFYKFNFISIKDWIRVLKNYLERRKESKNRLIAKIREEVYGDGQRDIMGVIAERNGENYWEARNKLSKHTLEDRLKHMIIAVRTFDNDEHQEIAEGGNFEGMSRWHGGEFGLKSPVEIDKIEFFLVPAGLFNIAKKVFPQNKIVKIDKTEKITFFNKEIEVPDFVDWQLSFMKINRDKKNFWLHGIRLPTEEDINSKIVWIDLGQDTPEGLHNSRRIKAGTTLYQFIRTLPQEYQDLFLNKDGLFKGFAKINDNILVRDPLGHVLEEGDEISILKDKDKMEITVTSLYWLKQFRDKLRKNNYSQAIDLIYGIIEGIDRYKVDTLYKLISIIGKNDTVEGVLSGIDGFKLEEKGHLNDAAMKVFMGLPVASHNSRLEPITSAKSYIETLTKPNKYRRNEPFRFLVHSIVNSIVFSDLEGYMNKVRTSFISASLVDESHTRVYGGFDSTNCRAGFIVEPVSVESIIFASSKDAWLASKKRTGYEDYINGLIRLKDYIGISEADNILKNTSDYNEILINGVKVIGVFMTPEFMGRWPDQAEKIISFADSNNLSKIALTRDMPDGFESSDSPVKIKTDLEYKSSSSIIKQAYSMFAEALDKYGVATIIGDAAGISHTGKGIVEFLQQEKVRFVGLESKLEGYIEWAGEENLEMFINESVSLFVSPGNDWKYRTRKIIKEKFNSYSGGINGSLSYLLDMWLNILQSPKSLGNKLGFPVSRQTSEEIVSQLKRIKKEGLCVDGAFTSRTPEPIVYGVIINPTLLLEKGDDGVSWDIVIKETGAIYKHYESQSMSLDDLKELAEDAIRNGFALTSYEALYYGHDGDAALSTVTERKGEDLRLVSKYALLSEMMEERVMHSILFVSRFNTVKEKNTGFLLASRGAFVWRVPEVRFEEIDYILIPEIFKEQAGKVFSDCREKLIFVGMSPDKIAVTNMDYFGGFGYEGWTAKMSVPDYQGALKQIVNNNPGTVLWVHGKRLPTEGDMASGKIENNKESVDLQSIKESIRNGDMVGSAGALLENGDKGGIAFNSLPIRTESVASSALGALSGGRAFRGDLDAEWARIQDVFNADIRPSVQRLSEYTAAAAASPLAEDKIDQVRVMLADILRRDEESQKPAPAEESCKQLLRALEAG